MWTPYRISSRREDLAVIEPEAFSLEAGPAGRPIYQVLQAVGP